MGGRRILPVALVCCLLIASIPPNTAPSREHGDSLMRVACQPAFPVNVTIDRGCGAVYHSGEMLTATVVPYRDALMLVWEIFPNTEAIMLDHRNVIANQTYIYVLTISASKGQGLANLFVEAWNASQLGWGECNFNILGRPDLLASDISWNATKPREGDVVEFTVLVENRGDVGCSSFDTRCYVNGSLVGTRGVASLSVSETEQLKFTWLVPNGSAGINVVKAVVDSGSSVPEINEANNEYNESFTVLPREGPDLMVSEIDWSPETPAEGHSVTFTARVRNDGNASCGGFWVAYYIDQALLATEALSGLASKQEVLRSFIWNIPFGSKGTHWVEVLVDTADEVLEEDEGNNDRKEQFSISTLNTPPVASLSANVTWTRPGSSVAFDASASHDPDGSVSEYKFNYGDGKISYWLSDPLSTHSYEAEGTYSARAMVRDDDEAISDWTDPIEILIVNKTSAAVMKEVASRYRDYLVRKAHAFEELERGLRAPVSGEAAIEFAEYCRELAQEISGTGGSSWGQAKLILSQMMGPELLLDEADAFNELAYSMALFAHAEFWDVLETTVASALSTDSLQHAYLGALSDRLKEVGDMYSSEAEIWDRAAKEGELSATDAEELILLLEGEEDLIEEIEERSTLLELLIEELRAVSVQPISELCDVEEGLEAVVELNIPQHADFIELTIQPAEPTPRWLTSRPKYLLTTPRVASINVLTGEVRWVRVTDPVSIWWWEDAFSTRLDTEIDTLAWLGRTFNVKVMVVDLGGDFLWIDGPRLGRLQFEFRFSEEEFTVPEEFVTGSLMMKGALTRETIMERERASNTIDQIPGL